MENISKTSDTQEEEDVISAASQYLLMDGDKIPVIYRESKSVKKAQEFLKEGYSISPLLWQSRLELFTRAAMHAPLQSRELALAYYNRSIELENGGLCEDSLADIDRTLNAHCSDDMRPMLYPRKLKFLKMKHGYPSIEVDKTEDEARRWREKMNTRIYKIYISDIMLSITQNRSREIFSKTVHKTIMSGASIDKGSHTARASNAIDVRYSEKFGLHIVATRDIEAGETLISSRCYASIIEPNLLTKYCWYCSKRIWAGIPCLQCTTVVYCDESCRDKAWKEHHDIECYAIPALLHQNMSSIELLTLRLTVKAIKEHTLHFIKERVMGFDVTTEPINMDSVRMRIHVSQHCSVYTMPTHKPITFGDALTSCLILYTLAATSEILGSRIEKYKELLANPITDFVGRLILRHHRICQFNAITLKLQANLHKQSKRGIFINPLTTQFNHSCDPSAMHYTVGDMTAMVSLQRIAAGEQIFVNYAPPFWEKPAYERIEYLERKFKFRCECLPCMKAWGPHSLLVLRASKDEGCVTDLEITKTWILTTTLKLINDYQKNVRIVLPRIIAAYKQRLIDIYLSLSE